MNEPHDPGMLPVEPKSLPAMRAAIADYLTNSPDVREYARELSALAEPRLVYIEDGVLARAAERLGGAPEDDLLSIPDFFHPTESYLVVFAEPLDLTVRQSYSGGEGAFPVRGVLFTLDVQPGSQDFLRVVEPRVLASVGAANAASCRMRVATPGIRPSTRMALARDSANPSPLLPVTERDAVALSSDAPDGIGYGMFSTHEGRMVAVNVALLAVEAVRIAGRDGVVERQVRDRKGPKGPDGRRRRDTVNVVAIAPRRRPDGPPEPVDWGCRWKVRGHWRNQPYGPHGSLRRRIWIDEYVKGPEGKPLVEPRETVYKAIDRAKAKGVSDGR